MRKFLKRLERLDPIHIPFIIGFIVVFGYAMSGLLIGLCLVESFLKG